MIIKAKSRAGAGSLGAHLGNAEKNERVQLLETRNVLAKDLVGALVEMEAVASGTRCLKPLYHAAISPEPPHRLTPEQRLEAVDALEEKLGLKGHQRVIVLHEKLGREHVHVVWSRIDIATMRSVHDGHNYRKHEEVSRDLERRFGHERVQGAHAERHGPDGRIARPDRTPSRSELRQEERTGIKGKDVKTEVSAVFRSSDSAEAFRSAIEERGYCLARGEKRDYVILDQAGGIHSLARRIDGMKADDLRAFMSPLDKLDIPGVEEARGLQLQQRMNEPGSAGQQIAWEDALGASAIAADAKRAAAAEALKRAKREAHLQNKRDAAYERSDDYATQSRAALRDHQHRQRELDKLNADNGVWDRIEAGEARRTEEARVAEKSRKKRSEPEEAQVHDRSGEDPPVGGDVEITDAMQARLDRLREAKAGYSVGPDTGRQEQAPGSGRPRSRS